ncbi:hypothetical protein [Larkinella soli]|uniref:hypothetical protein n=1 Tax=Larkinella soli TaxID=1770527 RepID=UPI000FFC45BC|nr:hypothetical protein [Larkinella soli]
MEGKLGKLISKLFIWLILGTFCLIIRNHRCIFLHVKLDTNDVFVLKQSYTGGEDHKLPYCFVGINNICKETPSQYKLFLERLSKTIADTSNGEIEIYFLIYNEEAKNRSHYLPPYRLEEEFENDLLLYNFWSKEKKLEYLRWYVPKLRYLNRTLTLQEALDSVTPK